VKKILAATLILFGLGATSPALSASPLEQSCAFANALASGGADAGLEQLRVMTAAWKPEDANKLGPIIGPVLARFNYVGGEIYSIAELGDALHEHLVVMRLRPSGAVYMRLLYEGNGSTITFVNIDFQAKFHDILKKPILQEPTRLTCD